MLADLGAEKGTTELKMKAGFTNLLNPFENHGISWHESKHLLKVGAKKVSTNGTRKRIYFFCFWD